MSSQSDPRYRYHINSVTCLLVRTWVDSCDPWQVVALFLQQWLGCVCWSAGGVAPILATIISWRRDMARRRRKRSSPLSALILEFGTLLGMIAIAQPAWLNLLSQPSSSREQVERVNRPEEPARADFVMPPPLALPQIAPPSLGNTSLGRTSLGRTSEVSAIPYVQAYR